MPPALLVWLRGLIDPGPLERGPRLCSLKDDPEVEPCVSTAAYGWIFSPYIKGEALGAATKPHKIIFIFLSRYNQYQKKNNLPTKATRTQAILPLL